MRRVTFVSLAMVLVAALACGGGDGGTTPDPALRDTVVTRGTAAATALTEASVAISPVVRVMDGTGHPIVNVPITYEVTAGGGRITSADPRTGADGLAHVFEWVLGATPGTNTLRVAAGSSVVTYDVVTTQRPPRPWDWQRVATPLGDGTVGTLMLDPTDAGRWYATSFFQGVYVSTDTGRTWQRRVAAAGVNHNGMAFDPRDARRVYAAAGARLWTSADRGDSWTPGFTFPRTIRSILVGSDGTVYAAPQWGATDDPGVYRSTDGGVTFTLHRFGLPVGTQLLTWALFENPRTGTLLAGSEIANHPQPYRPPLLRSRDGGLTWEDVTGNVPWHVISFAWDPAHERVLAVTEGSGVAVSADDGATWSMPSGFARFGNVALIDPREPERTYLSHFFFSTWPGGVWATASPTSAPVALGLVGSSVTSLVLHPDGSRMYAVVYEGGKYAPGIYTALTGGLP